MKISFFGSCLFILTSGACSVQRDMDDMRQNTHDVAQTTRDMQKSTDHVATISDGMAKNTENMVTTTEAMKHVTEEMLVKTQTMVVATEGMHQTTEGMAQTTTEMAQTIAAMSSKADELRAETANLYHDLRQADSARIRTDSLAKMDGTADQVGKLSHAARYFMAFEFQIWKNHGRDDPAALDILRRDAVAEFMRDIQGFMPNRPSISPASKTNGMKNLYALATALHSINSNSVAEDKSRAGGMLELLRRGLAAKPLVESGAVASESLPEYQREVLNFESHVVYLLNVRINFMPSMIVTELGTSGTRYLSKLSMLRMMVAPWKAHTDLKNQTQLEAYCELMDLVKATGQVLQDAGITPLVDGNLRRVLSKARLAVPDVHGPQGFRTAATAKLKTLLEAFVRGDAWRPSIGGDFSRLNSEIVALLDIYADAGHRGQVAHIKVTVDGVLDTGLLEFGHKISSMNLRYLKDGYQLRFTRDGTLGESFVAAAVGYDANVGLSHPGFNDRIVSIKAETRDE